MSSPPKLSKAQRAGLERIRDFGPTAWAYGKNRAGGAVSRMFDALALAGLCTTAPHKITPAGRDALRGKR